MFVNKILRSVYFWIALGGLAILLLLTKGGFSKLIKILKLLGTALLKILDIIFALFNLKLERVMNFEEIKEV